MGKVVAQSGDVVGVTIQNYTTKTATITDLDGNFSIIASVNDTLVLSAVQFKKKVLPVTKQLYDAKFVTIPLEEFVNELREVVVQPYDLSGDLSQDLGRLSVTKQVSATTLGLPNAGIPVPTQTERRIFEATSGAGLIPLNPILNAITGRTKRLKNQLKLERDFARTQRVQAFYVDSIFENHFKIPKKHIEDFMYFCEVDTSFQRKVDIGDRLRLWEYLEERSVVYRKNNNLD